MRLSALTGSVLILAACAPGEPPPAPAGSVEVGGTTYPVVSLANGSWRAYVDGAAVTCAQPSKTACYWSVRHHLQAQELLDDLG